MAANIKPAPAPTPRGRVEAQLAALVAEFQIAVRRALRDGVVRAAEAAFGESSEAPRARSGATTAATAPDEARLGRAPEAARRRQRRAPGPRPARRTAALVVHARPLGKRLPPRAAVLRQLRELGARGLRRRSEVARHAPRVLEAALAHFGTLPRARRAAGLPRVALGRPKKWTRELLASELCNLHADGVPITAPELSRLSRYDLLNAARQLAGGIPGARRIARIPDPVPQWRPPDEIWDAKRVVAEILDRHADGEPLAYSRVPQSLRRAAKNYFGSWQAAIERAGLDYDTIRLRRAGRSPDELLGELRQLAQDRPAATRKEIHSLPIAQSVKYAFGSLGAGLEAAALHGWPRLEHQRTPGKNATLEMVRVRHAMGRPMTPSSVHKDDARLYRAARRHFGSWDRAVEAAGLPIQRAWPRWSKERVITELQQLAEHVAPLTPGGIQRRASKLYVAARRQFGGVREAAIAAGVELTEAPKGPRLRRRANAVSTPVHAMRPADSTAGPSAAAG
jgi:hypothetical protein